MEILPDIKEKIELDFGVEAGAAKDEIEALYIKTNWRVTNRMIRAVVFLAKGDLASLTNNINLFLADYKDVLWSAEYDRGDVKLRDFNETFTDLAHSWLLTVSMRLTNEGLVSLASLLYDAGWSDQK